MRTASMQMSGFGLGIVDFDNDGWKDIFTTRGDVLSLPVYHNEIDQHNSVFRNPGPKGDWKVVDAGLAPGLRGDSAAALLAIWMAMAKSTPSSPRWASLPRFG